MIRGQSHYQTSDHICYGSHRKAQRSGWQLVIRNRSVFKSLNKMKTLIKEHEINLSGPSQTNFVPNSSGSITVPGGQSSSTAGESHSSS